MFYKIFIIVFCLRGYVGLSGCGLPAVDSGIYINQLPGIEFQQVQDIANSDQISFQQVWNDVESRAIDRFRLDVIGEISGFDKRYRLRQITQTVDLGKVLTTDTQVPSPNNSGLIIELMNVGDSCVCSNMQSIYVSAIQFYCVNAGSFIVTVKDADLNTTLDTFTVTGVQGWNAVKCDKQYDNVMRLSITVDTTALTTAKLDLSDFQLSNFGQQNWCSDCYGWSNNGLFFQSECTGTAQVRGYQTDSNFQTPIYAENTYGLSCVFSVKCSYNAVVCKNKRHFANAYRLVLGIELMTERIYSSRLNRWTTVDLKKAVQLRREFEVQYRGGQLDDNSIVYEGELKKACDGIDLDLSDCCLEADGLYRWTDTQL